MDAFSTPEPLNAVEKSWTAQWLRKADGDLRAAERLAPAAEDYDTAGFHCQQAVEKYLKGYLFVVLRRPARTHDLVALLSAIDPSFGFSANEVKMVKLLNPFAVDFRYPNDDEIAEPPTSWPPPVTSATAYAPPSKRRSANRFAPLPRQSFLSRSALAPQLWPLK